jgi:EAL domain-containing protein (putative c-di-GMP-specific phosphodiesterase class I)
MFIEDDLAAAIDAGELTLHYQPRVSFGREELVGFEALVRWNHPERGLLAPAEFLCTAPGRTLAIPLARWVLMQACHQMALWHRMLPMHPRLEISVNVSLKYITSPCIVRDIRRYLASTGLFPGSLKLEISERSIPASGVMAGTILHELKTMGIGLEIDDFGTGPDSLGYLRELPFDTLKIDGSFVTQLGRRHDSSETIHTIVKFMAAHGIDVSAECVETKTQLNILKGLGCGSGQGNYFSQPVDRVHAQSFIRDEILKRETIGCKRVINSGPLQYQPGTAPTPFIFIDAERHPLTFSLVQ